MSFLRFASAEDLEHAIAREYAELPHHSQPDNVIILIYAGHPGVRRDRELGVDILPEKLSHVHHQKNLVMSITVLWKNKAEILYYLKQYTKFFKAITRYSLRQTIFIAWNFSYCLYLVGLGKLVAAVHFSS